MNKKNKIALSSLALIPIALGIFLYLNSGDSLKAPDQRVFLDGNSDGIPDYAQERLVEVRKVINTLALSIETKKHLNKILSSGLESLVIIYTSKKEEEKIQAAKIMKCINREVRIIRMENDLQIRKLLELKKHWDFIKVPKGTSNQFVSTTILRLGSKAKVNNNECYSLGIAMEKRENTQEFDIDINPLNLVKKVTKFIFNVF